jgi:CubicO group peptidase (beta-lactamase class C family)
MIGLINSKSLWRASAALVAMASLGPLWHRSDALTGNAAQYTTLGKASDAGTAALTDAIEPLFDEETVGATQALVVLHDGVIVAERYGAGIGPDTKLLSRSLGKTVTAALVGLMVSDGRLALDMPVPVDAWSQPGDPRGAITLRNLLQMTSGLEHVEDKDPLYESDTVRMLFTDGAQDMAAFAEAKPVARPPGSMFVYSTADTMILSDLMTRMLTDSDTPDMRRAAMMEFMQGRLMAPAGLTSLTPEFDMRGTMIGGAMLHMTARDYARFGELLRNRGRVNGHQLLPARWVEFMTTPSPHNPAYGGHVWLNRDGPESPLFPGRASSRLFAAVGHHGQYILISPTQRLVIVRIGISTMEERVPLRAALARLIGLFPRA